MYKGTNYHIKCHGFDTLIKPTRGVKQGCFLSPILSNIFQNDLHKIFKDDPIKIGILNLNSIPFADDGTHVFIPIWVKEILDNLHKYCDKWGISINTDKFNYLIMSKVKLTKNLPLFQINNDTLDYIMYIHINI